MNYKINGQTVSKAEWDQHHKKKVSLYGDYFEDMLQSRTAPIMANSDRAFLYGMGAQTLTHGLDEVCGDRTLARARKAGINPQGKVYMSQLGTAENPLAWVSGMDDVRDSCIRQGKGCDDLGIKAVQPELGPNIPLAEHIIEEFALKRLAADPDLAAKIRENPAKAQELREQVIDKHGTHD